MGWFSLPPNRIYVRYYQLYINSEFKSNIISRTVLSSAIVIRMSRILYTLVLLGLVLFSVGHSFEDFPHPDHGFHGFDHDFEHGFDHDFDHDSDHDSDHDFDHGFHHDFHHGHDSDNCDKHKSPSIRDTINRIKRKYSTAKSTLKKFCKENTQIAPKILYGTDAYIIKYSLPNLENLNITIKAVNGLVVTEVEEQGDFKGFQDVRILPEILDLQKGFWTIEQSNLKILLPYKVTLATEFNTVCEPDDSEVNIPGNILPLFEVRINKSKK